MKRFLTSCVDSLKLLQPSTLYFQISINVNLQMVFMDDFDISDVYE